MGGQIAWLTLGAILGAFASLIVAVIFGDSLRSLWEKICLRTSVWFAKNPLTAKWAAKFLPKWKFTTEVQRRVNYSLRRINKETLGYRLPEVRIIWGKFEQVPRGGEFVYVVNPERDSSVNVIDLLANIVEEKIMEDVRLLVDEPLASAVKAALVWGLARSFIYAGSGKEREEFMKFKQELRERLPVEQREAFDRMLERVFEVEKAGILRNIWLFTVNFAKRRLAALSPEDFERKINTRITTRALGNFLLEHLYTLALKEKGEDVPLPFVDDDLELKVSIILVAKEDKPLKNHAEVWYRHAIAGFNPIFTEAMGANVDRLKYLAKKLLPRLEDAPPYKRYESEARVLRGGKPSKLLVYAFEFYETPL